jgi:hypothetical protein
MKHYHSIEKNVQDYIGQHTFAFNKFDGSNFCAEWNKKLSKKSRFTYGFGKFGTRTQMIKNKENPYVEAVNIFMDKYAIPLDKIFNEEKIFRGIDTITVYGEFFGDHSFAGMHDWQEKHDVIIFDMFLYKKDFLKPGDFIDLFSHLGIPKVVYKGLLTDLLIKDVEVNAFGWLKEGVVLKGVQDNKVWMAKLKTNAWLEKVRALYGINNNIE